MIRPLSYKSQLKRTLNLLFRDEARGSSRGRDFADRAVYLYRRESWQWARHLHRGIDKIPLTKPIFLLGVQGGGLTLLAHALQRHPAVVTMSGNNGYWTALNEIGAEPSRMRALPPSLWGCKFRDDLEHPVFGTKHSNVYATSELIDHYRRTADDATPEERRTFERVLREHIAVYARNPQHARFLDKTQTYTINVAFLNALLEEHDPRFVLMVRNPYTMAYRSIRRQPPSYRKEVAYETQLRLMAEHWAVSCGLALEDGANLTNFHVLRFEDLIERPEGMLREVCDFVELDFRDDMLPQPQHRLPLGSWPGEEKWFGFRPDEWRGKLSEREVAIIDESCCSLAERFGYARATSTANVSGAAVDAAPAASDDPAPGA